MTNLPMLFTASDIADALEVTPASVSGWIKSNETAPKPSFARTNGSPLWESLEPWHEWNHKRLEALEAKNKARAEARLAKAKAELEAAMAAMEEG